jgi:hypothetical protein
MPADDTLNIRVCPATAFYGVGTTPPETLRALWGRTLRP